jgi:hypothetical protein
VSRPNLRECHPALWADLRADWWERIAAAGAVRRQSFSAVGADLPVWYDLALALLALVEELVKFLLELPDGGLHLALRRLLPLLLVVHCLPPVSTLPQERYISVQSMSTDATGRQLRNTQGLHALSNSGISYHSITVCFADNIWLSEIGGSKNW